MDGRTGTNGQVLRESWSLIDFVARMLKEFTSEGKFDHAAGFLMSCIQKLLIIQRKGINCQWHCFSSRRRDISISIMLIPVQIKIAKMS
jgi:hypothetical protein